MARYLYKAEFPVSDDDNREEVSCSSNEDDCQK